MHTNHKQLPIYNEFGVEVFTVEENCQSLIQLLVDLGFEAFNAYPDDIKDFVRIDLVLDSWKKICESALSQQSPDLMRFIRDNCGPSLFFLDEGHSGVNDELCIESQNFLWIVSVQFPKKDIQNFERLIRFNFVHFDDDESLSIQ